MTREEIKAFGKHIADKVFHKKHKEVKIEGTLSTFSRIAFVEVINNRKTAGTIDFSIDFLKEAGFKPGDDVEITIKSI